MRRSSTPSGPSARSSIAILDGEAVPAGGLGIARRARVGTFGVNLYVPDIGAPWGGRKASGMGSVYGPEGLQTYLATKCVFLPG